MRYTNFFYLPVGIYSLTWVFQTLYHTLPKDQRKPPTVTSQMTPYHLTGADESTSIILSFPTSTPSNTSPPRRSHGIALTNIRVSGDPDEQGTSGPNIRIQGTKGEIAVKHPAYRPSGYKVIRKGGGVESFDCVVPKDPARGDWGMGMFWEADECARCLRDGKLESEGMPLGESIEMMRVMEEVWRGGKVVYPDVITTNKYDPESPHNVRKA